MPGLFSKIVSGEIPCHKIAENESCFAFLDVFPLKRGHTLVIPKQEIDYIFDLNNDLYNELFTFSKLIAPAVKLAFPCKKVGISVIGLEVPHAHIHLIPMNTIQDMNFSGEKLKPNNAELAADAALIRSFLNEGLS